MSDEDKPMGKNLLWWVGYYTIGFIHFWILIGFLVAIILAGMEAS